MIKNKILLMFGMVIVILLEVMIIIFAMAIHITNIINAKIISANLTSGQHHELLFVLIFLDLCATVIFYFVTTYEPKPKSVGKCSCCGKTIPFFGSYITEDKGCLHLKCWEKYRR